MSVGENYYYNKNMRDVDYFFFNHLLTNIDHVDILM